MFQFVPASSVGRAEAACAAHPLIAELGPGWRPSAATRLLLITLIDFLHGKYLAGPISADLEIFEYPAGSGKAGGRTAVHTGYNRGE